MTTTNLPLRPRSARAAKSHRFGKVTTAINGEEEPTTGAMDKRTPAKSSQLYPGLNDITDAFEAFPTDMVKYFTLLKEIDAKCVQPLPELEHQIKKFQNLQNTAENKFIRNETMCNIAGLLNDILPCLEEKMHVASIGADKALSYIDRINDDYDLIVHKEIPESITIGNPNHPAIMDIKVADNKSAQSQRSESRREALAARKANTTETDNEEAGNTPAASNNNPGNKGSKARKGGASAADKEGTPVPNQGNANNTGSGANKKRRPNNSNNSSNPTTTTTTTSNNKDKDGNPSGQSNVKEDGSNIQRPDTPSSSAGNKRRAAQKKKTNNSTNNNTSNTANDATNGNEDAGNISTNSNNNKNKKVVEPDEPVYCYCNQVSYGEMVGCDGEDCKREWFHLPCTGLSTLPRGRWFCEDCKAKNKKK